MMRTMVPFLSGALLLGCGQSIEHGDADVDTGSDADSERDTASDGGTDSGGPEFLVTVTEEPGPDCSGEGLSVHAFVDENGNGALDENEPGRTYFLCHGASCDLPAPPMYDTTGTYQAADDADDDGWADDLDNCRHVPNLEQEDGDVDGMGDLCDACPGVTNSQHRDQDGDGLGDLCDPDIDNDGHANNADNCPDEANPDQADTDGDNSGDACDPDDDGDLISDFDDNCPLISNPSQNPIDGHCYDDQDGDTVPDHIDNCPALAFGDMADLDDDGQGDACDADRDGDGVINSIDSCSDVYNADQVNSDRDLQGDACDAHFCYVVFGDLENCLDPEAPLQAYIPTIFASVGEAVQLRLFVNRYCSIFEYDFVIEQAPHGSAAGIRNPRGATGFSSPFEYRYIEDLVATLTPDLAGTYRVRVDIRQPFEDAVSGQRGMTFSRTSTIVVQ